MGSGALVEEEDVNMSLEDKELVFAFVVEVIEVSRKMQKSWAANDKAIRIGETLCLLCIRIRLCRG